MVESRKREPSAFARLLAASRETAGLSQARLATKAGVSASYISGIEAGHRGDRPSRDIVLALARALEVDPLPLLRAAGRAEPEDETGPRRPSFEQFVAGDPLLRQQEREMLVSLYRSYVGGRSPRERH